MLLLAILCLVAFSQLSESAGDCQEYKTFSRFVRLGCSQVEGPKECQLSCASTNLCSFWNFDSRTKKCCRQGIKSVSLKEAVVSGKKNCDMLTCRSSEAISNCINYKRYLKPVKIAKLKSVGTVEKCKTACQRDRQCSLWVYWIKKKTCLLRGIKPMSIKRMASGKMSCRDLCQAINGPTTTESTTTSVPLPAECSDYNILDDSTRSVTSTGDKYCDSNIAGATTSPDWQGSGWYRMMPPAGTMMPTSAVDKNYCGTEATGWITGTHPTEVGTSSFLQVCFNWLDYICTYGTTIKATNCDTFYVYFLNKLNVCKLRYCATN